jgi:hypothetical protein
MIHDFEHSLRGRENQSNNQKMKSKQALLHGSDGLGWSKQIAEWVRSNA